MTKYAKTLKALTSRGYKRDRALLLIQDVFKLTPEQVVILDRLTK